VSLPRSEHIARAEITVPLFPEMDEPTQDRVVGALAEALS
jgi:dTDP-4-amino-4,6-dideoxygalactose transaminase